MRPVIYSLGYVFAAESNGITHISVKSILVQKIAYSSIYDIIMFTEHFEIKNKDLRPLWLKIESYQLCF